MISKMSSSCLHLWFKWTSLRTKRSPYWTQNAPAASPPLLSQPARFAHTPSYPSSGILGGILMLPPPCSSDAYWLKGGVQSLGGWGRSWGAGGSGNGGAVDWVPPTHSVCLDGLYLLAHSPDRRQTEGWSGTPFSETFPVLPWRWSLPSVDGLRTSAGACAPSRVIFLYFSPADWGALEHGNGFLNLWTRSGYSRNVWMRANEGTWVPWD